MFFTGCIETTNKQKYFCYKVVSIWAEKRPPYSTTEFLNHELLLNPATILPTKTSTTD